MIGETLIVWTRTQGWAFAAKFAQTFRLSALLVCLAACAQVSNQAASTSQAFTNRTPLVLSIVGTNDLHGHINNLPWFAGQLANLRAARAHDGAVILLDAGDMFQGTLASNLGEGHVVVEAYNKLGYDAAAIGNHEFDFGPEGGPATPRSPQDDPRGALKARAKQAQFPFLAANVFEVGEEIPLQGKNIFPTAMLKRNGIAVGLIGVSTEDTPRATLARNFKGLRLQPLAPTINHHAGQLRVLGAQVVVVLAHAGAACSGFQSPTDLSTCAADAEIFEVARKLTPGLVDAIVAGHTHAGVAHEVAGIPIIEAHSYGRAFGRVDLLLEPQSMKVLGHKLFPPHDICAHVSARETCTAQDYEGRAVMPDPLVAQVIANAMALVNTHAQRSLNTQAEGPIKRAYKTESALGNLFTDLMRAARPQATVAITNGGGLRQDLPHGPLLYKHLYEAMPFDNTFASATITAGQLAEVFRRNLQGEKGILSISGLRVHATCVGRHLAVQLQHSDGSKLQENEPLRLLTTDFLATGGDGLLSGMGFDLEAAPPVRDEMARVLIEAAASLNPQALFDPARPRIVYPGPRPVRCGL